MITPAQTRSKYLEIESQLEFVRNRIRETLQTFCEPRGYALVLRIKSLDSVSEKIETGRFEKWSELDDLIACAIVIPTLAAESAALRFLQSAFDEVVVKKRGSTKKAPETFRFDTTRFIGRLRRPEDIPPDVPAFLLSFEIQIRSAFEHAWAVTTHALTYKAGQVAWNRFRLTAQLKAAVEQLDVLVLGFEETSARIGRNSWPETQAKSDLAAYFKRKFKSGALPNELCPKDWTRFSENVFEMVRASAWAQQKNPLHLANAVSKTMDDAIDKLGRDKIPVSISLVQFVFATLFIAGVVAEPLRGYCPVITSELESLYPTLAAFQTRFDFSR